MTAPPSLSASRSRWQEPRSCTGNGAVSRSSCRGLGYGRSGCLVSSSLPMDYPTPLEVLGRELPGNWHHHPPLRFRVVADVTPLERGSFGHRGTLNWRLRVDRWDDVVEA